MKCLLTYESTAERGSSWFNYRHLCRSPSCFWPSLKFIPSRPRSSWRNESLFGRLWSLRRNATCSLLVQTEQISLFCFTEDRKKIHDILAMVINSTSRCASRSSWSITCNKLLLFKPIWSAMVTKLPEIKLYYKYNHMLKIFCKCQWSV